VRAQLISQCSRRLVHRPEGFSSGCSSARSRFGDGQWPRCLVLLRTEDELPVHQAAQGSPAMALALFNDLGTYPTSGLRLGAHAPPAGHFQQGVTSAVSAKAGRELRSTREARSALCPSVATTPKQVCDPWRLATSLIDRSNGRCRIHGGASCTPAPGSPADPSRLDQDRPSVTKHDASMGQRKPTRQLTGGSFGGAGFRFSGHHATPLSTGAKFCMRGHVCGHANVYASDSYGSFAQIW
jgi:hypothetical protein